MLSSVLPLPKRWITQKQKNSSAICLLLLSRSTFTTFMQRFEFIKNQHKCKSGIISPITPDFLLPYQCSVYIFPAVRHKKLWFSPQLYKQKKTTDFSVVVGRINNPHPFHNFHIYKNNTDKFPPRLIL